MAAILDLSNMAPMAGVQFGTRKKAKVYMALAIRGPNLVLLGRFEQFGGKYGLSPLTIRLNNDLTFLFITCAKAFKSLAITTYEILTLYKVMSFTSLIHS